MLKKLWIVSALVLSSTFLFTACSNNEDGGSAGATEPVRAVGGAMMSSTTLPNGIRVLMVSSPAASQASLTVTVGAGSYHEPAELPGLAHFLEHVLFLGNKENPVPDEYFKFMNAKGATINATTSAEFTNYYLQIGLKDYKEGVRRLSRFFVSPLFDKALIASEKAVIQNEYTGRLKSSQKFRGSAAYFPEGALARRFSTGNLESLKNARAEDARKFFETHYAPQNMTVVVNGPQPLAELKAIATGAFSDVPSRPGPQEVKNADMDKAQLGRIMKIQNEEQANQLEIRFDSTLKEVSLGTQQIIGTILGDEGPGSLLSVLQARGLAARRKGAITGGTSGPHITLTIQLTPDGVENYQEVIAVSKGYIEFMKSSAMPAHLVKKAEGLYKVALLEEDYSTGDLEKMISAGRGLLSASKWTDLFEFRDLDKPTEADYKKVLAASQYEKFFGTLTSNLSTTSMTSLGLKGHIFADLERLEEVTVNGKQYVIDGWYDGAYEILTPTASGLAPLSDAGFRLPPENPYVPTQFAMYDLNFTDTAVAGTNAEIRLNPGAGVALPKSFFAALITPKWLDKSDKKQMSRFILMASWIQASLSQDGYLFEEVGYKTNLSTHILTGTVLLQFSGWSDQFERAATDYIKAIRFSEDELSFEKFKQVQIVGLKQSSITPDNAVGEAFNLRYSPTVPTKLERIAAIENMTHAELKRMYIDTFKDFYFQGMLSGNIQPSQAKSILEAMAQKWPQQNTITAEEAEKHQDIFKTTLAQPVSVEINLGESVNSNVVRFYQFGSDSKREYNIARILSSWIEHPMFDELRTKQQITYTPRVGLAEMGPYYGLYVAVESGTNSARDVTERVNAFIIKWVEEELPKKTQLDVDEKIAEYKKLNDIRFLSHNEAIAKYLFDGDELYADDSQQYEITVQDVVEFVRKKLVQSPEGVFIQVKSTLDLQEAPKVLHMGSK